MKTKSHKQASASLSDSAIVQETSRSIRQMRLNKNMSQEQVAKMSGLSRITISRMEAGRAATLLTIVQVLRALDKLEILNAFHEEAEVSPMQLFKLQEQKRQRASQKRNSVTNEKKRISKSK